MAKRTTKNAHGLTPQQEAFAAGLAAGMTQADAYRRAYPAAIKWKHESVWQTSSALAADTKVRARVADLLAAAAEAAQVDVNEVVRKLALILRADPRELVQVKVGCCPDCHDEEGSPARPPNQECGTCAGEGIQRTVLSDTRNLSPEAAALYAGAKQTKYGIEIIMHSRDAAMEKLMRYLGAYERDNAQQNPLGGFSPQQFFDDIFRKPQSPE
jgi:hypothetical protein